MARRARAANTAVEALSWACFGRGRALGLGPATVLGFQLPACGIQRFGVGCQLTALSSQLQLQLQLQLCTPSVGTGGDQCRTGDDQCRGLGRLVGFGNKRATEAVVGSTRSGHARSTHTRLATAHTAHPRLPRMSGSSGAHCSACTQGSAPRRSSFMNWHAQRTCGTQSAAHGVAPGARLGYSSVRRASRARQRAIWRGRVAPRKAHPPRASSIANAIERLGAATCAASFGSWLQPFGSALAPTHPRRGVSHASRARPPTGWRGRVALCEGPSAAREQHR